MPISHGYKAISLSRVSFAIIAVAPFLSLGACASEPSTTAAQAVEASTGSSQNDSVSASCLQSIPALEEAGYGEQSGHLQALKLLETCYTRLGQTDKAKRTHWRIYKELTRRNPHDW